MKRNLLGLCLMRHHLSRCTFVGDAPPRRVMFIYERYYVYDDGNIELLGN
jgi:hypothetical protein